MNLKEDVIVHPVSFSPLIQREVVQTQQEIKGLEDIPITITSELGRTKMLIKDVLKIKEDMILKLDKSIYDLCEVLVNGKRIARGQIIVHQNKLAIRITKLLDE